MRKIVTFCLLFGLILELRAQDTDTDSHDVTVSIPEIAIVDVESTSGSNNLTFSLTVPTEAGEPLGVPAPNSNLWLNYSSVLATSGSSRKVMVRLDAVVDGVDLKLSAGSDSGQGDGTLGTPGAEIILSTTDQDLVTGIGSCYTGSGNNKGHNLTYSIAVDGTSANYADLVQSSNTVSVTYTIADN